MLIFRKATANDANAITTLYQELATKSPVDILPERITEIAEDPNTYLIICEDDKVILATALLTLCNDVMFRRQPFAVIENFIVNKEFQRKNIGKSLMRYIEKICRERDCSKIMLLSNTENRGAHTFYIATGYNSDAKVGFIKYRRYFETNLIQEETSCGSLVQE
ncbi:MAG: GNAT family N-acetyltransferase [Chitinophagaceae bacterium]|nr:MAG: GNAT family N-acetyltransferase [Chitinophagaceae bacterium]